MIRFPQLHNVRWGVSPFIISAKLTISCISSYNKLYLLSLKGAGWLRQVQIGFQSVGLFNYYYSAGKPLDLTVFPAELKSPPKKILLDVGDCS